MGRANCKFVIPGRAPPYLKSWNSIHADVFYPRQFAADATPSVQSVAAFKRVARVAGKDHPPMGEELMA